MDHIVEPTEDEIISEASFIEMKTYVKYCLYFGYSRQEIISALRSVGWENSEISKAFDSLHQKSPKNHIVSAKKEIPVPKARNEPAPIVDIPAPKPKSVLATQDIEAPKPSS